MKRLFLFGLFGLGFILISSCCIRTDSQGVTTKSFPNCVQTAQETVCDPPDSVKALVQMAAPIIAGLVNAAIPGSVGYFNAQMVLNVVNSIQKVGCTSLTALNQLIAFMQSEEFMVAAHTGKYAAMPMTVDIQPLIDWSQTAK